ncbi:MAG: hypothetical protein QM687_05045 [Ferruginibacter sp.]
MKTLIYDNECPLCTAYTGAFVKTGLLEKEGRKNFNEVSPAFLQQLDSSRCHNEIPLIDDETGKTWYGIDALLEVLGARMSFFKTVGQYPPVHWLLRKLYSLISYNRKVIVAVASKGYDCSPAFSSRYRLLFLALGLIFNSWLFGLSIALFTKSIFPAGSFMQMQTAHYTLVSINIGIAIILGKQRGFDYLGQINMLALITMLLLLPLIFLQDHLPLAILSAAIGFIGCFIIKEYIRRMEYAGILKNYRIIAVIHFLCMVAACVYLN